MMFDPTPEQVEAAAKAIWTTRYPDSRPDIAEETWAEVSGYGAWTPEALDILTEARAALVAAAGAAPQAEQEAFDEEQIVGSVLAELEDHRATGDTGGWGTTFHRHGLSNEIHRGVDYCGRGTGKPVYVFDPDYLEAHDEWVIQATLRAVAGATQVQVDEAKLAVDVPSIPFGPEGVPEDKANAGYYRAAAKNIRYHASRGRSVMGSNLTEAVACLCDATADALYERHRLRGGAQ